MKNIYDFTDTDKRKSKNGCNNPKRPLIGSVLIAISLAAMLVFGPTMVTGLPPLYLSLQQEVYAQEEPVEVEICSDGIDNDNDGQVDEEPCELVSGTNEICSDGIDNDNDGQVDEEPCELVSGTNAQQSNICNPSSATLSRGSQGPEVTNLQNILIRLGYNVGPADGDFGESTAAAVIKFQQDNGLTADGVVGPNTWNALCSLL